MRCVIPGHKIIDTNTCLLSHYQPKVWENKKKKKWLVLGRGFISKEGENLPLVVYFLLLLGDLWPSYLSPSHCLVKRWVETNFNPISSWFWRRCPTGKTRIAAQDMSPLLLYLYFSDHEFSLDWRGLSCRHSLCSWFLASALVMSKFMQQSYFCGSFIPRYLLQQKNLQSWREAWLSNPNTTGPSALGLSAVIKSYLSLSLQENKSSFSKGRLWRNDMIWVLLQNSYLLTFIGHPLSARSHSKDFTYINSFSLCNNLMIKVQFPCLIFIWKSSQTKPQARYRDVKCFAWSRVPRGGTRSPKPEPAVTVMYSASLCIQLIDCSLEKDSRLPDWSQGDQSVMIAKSRMVPWTEVRESRMERT